MFKDLLRKYLEIKGVTQSELSMLFGDSQQAISDFLLKNSNPRKKTREKYFEKLVGFEDFYNQNTSNNAAEKIKTEHKSEEIIIRNELTAKTYEGKTPVKVISSTVQASWSDAYYANEYIKDVPTILIESDEDYKGKYLAFEVEGESMEPDYYAGDIVICREVQRHLWLSKLHYDDYDYVIAHGTQGIMLKEITSHNIENGEINCHSLHPNHEDFTLNLREVAFLYNVTEVRQKGRSKKRNR